MSGLGVSFAIDTASAKKNSKPCPVHSQVAIADKKGGPKWMALLSIDYNEYYYVNAYTGDTVWSLPPDVQPSDVGAPGWQGAQTTPVGECTCGEKINSARRASLTAVPESRQHQQPQPRQQQQPPQRQQQQQQQQHPRRGTAPPAMHTASEDQVMLSKTMSMANMRMKLPSTDTSSVRSGGGGGDDSNYSSPPVSSPDEAASILHNGAIFLKHGRHRKPHWKFVRLLEGQIEWLDLKQVQKNDTAGKKTVRVADIIKVHAGKFTPVFKHKRCDQVNDALCLSIVTKDRTLDLQAPTVEIRSIWVSALLSARTTTTFEVLMPASAPPPPTVAPESPDHTQTQINHKRYLRAAAEQQQERVGFRGRTVQRTGPSNSQTTGVRRPTTRSKSVHASRIPKARAV